MAVAADGSVYVAGGTEVAGQPKLLLRKYSAAGAVHWTKVYGAPERQQ